MKRTARLLCAALTITAAGLAAAPSADACTRVLWNDNQLAVLTARSMDWPQTTEPILTVFPRGLKHDGAKLGTSVVVKENPKTWTSKYGSLVTTVYGVGTVDGLNERGLGVHALYLNATDFGPRDPSLPGIQAALWPQYVLDNAANVNEAVGVLETVQPVMVEMHGFKSAIHLAIEDASGDSAIVEYVDGKRTIHHGRQYKIMTNDPRYEEQLALLKKQDFSNPRSDMPLAGNVNPVDRFQRAAYYSALLPKPKDEREAVASMFAIARNVSVPFGAPYKNFGIYNTEYRTVINLTTKRYWFELSTSPNVIWVDLSRMNLTRGAPVKVLDPDNLALTGNVSDKFKRAKAPF